MIKYYETLVVGTQKNVPFSTESYPLAFATYFEKDDSAYQSRLSTMKSWCGTANPFAPVTIENKAIAGFRISGWTSRWTTSNKWFDVYDPRGFRLQISAENLYDLINNTVIDHGLVMEDCVWTRENSMNVLTLAREAKAAIDQSKNPALQELQIGDLINIRHIKNVVYCGKFLMDEFGFEYLFKDSETGLYEIPYGKLIFPTPRRQSSWGYNRVTAEEQQKTEENCKRFFESVMKDKRAFVVHTSTKKVVHVFRYDKGSSVRYHTSNTIPKTFELLKRDYKYFDDVTIPYVEYGYAKKFSDPKNPVFTGKEILDILNLSNQDQIISLPWNYSGSREFSRPNFTLKDFLDEGLFIKINEKDEKFSTTTTFRKKK